MVFEKRPSVVDGSDGQQEHGSNHWGNVWVGCGTSVRRLLFFSLLLHAYLLTLSFLRSELFSTKAYLVRLSTVPKFLSDFPTATVRSLPDMSKDEINGLCLDDDGGVLGWCGDDGRLGVGKCSQPPCRFHVRSLMDHWEGTSRSANTPETIYEGQTLQRMSLQCSFLVGFFVCCYFG